MSKPYRYEQSRSTQGTGTRSYFKDEDEVPEQTLVPREKFENRLHCVFTYIGYVVGPGNILRFPFEALRHGGAIFILRYMLAMAVFTLPISFIEYTLGQFSGKNTVRVWDMSPAFRGIGFTSCLMSMTVAIVIHVFMAYSAMYAFSSFQHDLPWSVCKPDWKKCFSNFSVFENLTFCTPTSTDKGCLCSGLIQKNCTQPPVHAAEFYFKSIILREQVDAKNPGFGAPSWEMVLILIGSWFLVTVCFLKGIRYTSSIFHVTVLGPYVGLILLLIKGAAQNGASKGMAFLFQPEAVHWKDMASIQSWLHATTLSLFSMSTGYGVLFTLGSYNHFKDKLFVNVLVGSGVDLLTSLLCVLVVSFGLGHYSYIMGEGYPMMEALKSDMEVAFVFYPASLATFQWSNFWSFLYFTTLYLLAIDTEFGILETAMTYLQDDFKVIRRHSVMTRIICSITCCIVDILLLCPGGNKALGVINYYGSTFCLPVVVAFEVIGIMWVYGFLRFLEDIEYMSGIKVRCAPLLFVYGQCLLPALTLLILAGAVSMHFSEEHLSPVEGTVGMCISILVLSPISIWFGLHLYKFSSNKRNRKYKCTKFVSRLMRPLKRWGPNDGTNPRQGRHTVFADIFTKMRTRRKPTSSIFTTTGENEFNFEQELENFFGPGAASAFNKEKRFSQPFIPSMSGLSEETQSHTVRSSTVGDGSVDARHTEEASPKESPGASVSQARPPPQGMSQVKGGSEDSSKQSGGSQQAQTRGSIGGANTAAGGVKKDGQSGEKAPPGGPRSSLPSTQGETGASGNSNRAPDRSSVGSSTQPRAKNTKAQDVKQ